MRILFFLAVFFFGISCTSTTEKSLPDQATIQRSPTKKEALVSELTRNYPVEYYLDTVTFQYSIQLEGLINSEYQLVSNFYINDIFKEDSTYYLSIVNLGTSFPGLNYYLVLRVPEFQLENVLALTSEIFWKVEDIILLVDIKKVKRST